LQRSGAVADGFGPDGTTRTGGGAEDYLVDPVSSSSLATITRNAAVTRINNPRVNTVMSPAPTITTSLTHDATLTTAYGWNGGSGGSTIYDPPAGNGPFNYSGGVPSQNGFGGVQMLAATYDTGSFRTMVVSRMETVVDAVKVEFQLFCFQANARFRVIVDGQYASLAETTPASVSNTSYVVLDFTAAGGRKVRRVIIESYQISYGSIMSVGPTATMQKPGGAVKKMCVVADSWGVGTASTILNCFPQYLGDLLGIANVENNGVPATGYLANNGGANLTARQRIVPDVVPFAPDLLLITMGFNDATSNTTALQALQTEVTLTLQTVRQQPVLANIPIIVCPFGGNHFNTITFPTEAAIQAGVTASGSPFTYFIPTVNGPNGPWMTGTGNTSAPAGNGNCDIYISSDGTHPNDAGHAFLASRLCDEIMRLAV
jgi:lysophospholipase L1-like esterase